MRLALLIGLSLLLAPLQAAGQNCPVYGLEPAIPLLNPPAMLPDGFALTSHFGDFFHSAAAVLRFDKSGHLLWTRRLSADVSGLDWASSTKDGALLVAGSARTSDGSGAIICKLRPDGAVAWSRFVRGVDARVWGFIGAPDGGGYASLWGGLADVPKTQIGLALRFTAEGEIAWAKTIGVGDEPITQPVLASQADGVLIAKTWQVAFDKLSAILLIKLTQSGDLSWTRLISSGKRDLGASDVAALDDGSFIVVGSAQGTGVDGSDSSLIHVDKDGSPLTGSALHAPPLGKLHLISRDADGSLLLGGTTAHGGPSLADPVDPSQPTIARVTVDGQVAWAKAEDFGMTGGMLFGLMHGQDQAVAVGSRGAWGPAMLMRLTADGEPFGEGWSAATPVHIGSQKLDLTAAPIEVELRPLRLAMIDAGLNVTEILTRLVPLCGTSVATRRRP